MPSEKAQPLQLIATIVSGLFCYRVPSAEGTAPGHAVVGAAPDEPVGGPFLAINRLARRACGAAPDRSSSWAPSCSALGTRHPRRSKNRKACRHPPSRTPCRRHRRSRAAPVDSAQGSSSPSSPGSCAAARRGRRHPQTLRSGRTPARDHREQQTAARSCITRSHSVPDEDAFSTQPLERELLPVTCGIAD